MDCSSSFKEKDGRTPMHWACRNGKIEVIEYFLLKSVDINIRYIYNKEQKMEQLLCIFPVMEGN